MKTNTLIYRIATILFSMLILMSAGMYFLKNDYIRETFTNLGFPTYIIYPLAIAKILGVIVLLTRKPKLLVNMAYAGFFFNLLLAGSAHLNAKDGEVWGAVIGLALLLTSFYFKEKVALHDS